MLGVVVEVEDLNTPPRPASPPPPPRRRPSKKQKSRPVREERLFTVKCIRAYNPKTDQVLVSWRGFSQSSWQDKAQMEEDVPELMAAFMRKLTDAELLASSLSSASEQPHIPFTPPVPFGSLATPVESPASVKMHSRFFWRCLRRMLEHWPREATWSDKGWNVADTMEAHDIESIRGEIVVLFRE